MKFEVGKSKRSRTKLIVIVVGAAILVTLIASAVVVRHAYNENLKPLSTVSKTHVVTIQPGMTTPEVGDLLQTKQIIKNGWAFEWYVRNHQLQDDIKAGTYILDQSKSVPELVNILVEGKVATDLVTILPGQRLDQVKASLLKSGFSASDVETALDPAQYQGHPALVDKPKEASLEGYLYPESFQKTAETSAKQIVRSSLDEMQLRLTPELRQDVAKRGLSLHQAIILASIIEQEVSRPEDRALVSQVFQKRLREGIRLESDATNDYAKLSPTYNTYEIAGLPPGPIGNITESSLAAVANPAQTDWLYFVSGDDGKTHFSKTLKEHQELTKKYCTKLCS